MKVRGYEVAPKANLYGADLSEANLYRANLYRADLYRADLSGANLSEANLYRADLYGANLSGASLPPFQIPAGGIIGWKKASGVIVELLIPDRAKRTASLVGRKCRAEMAFVRKVHDKSGIAISEKGSRYCEGQEIWPDSYDDDIRVECTHGVHFFLTREEAEAWG